MASPSDNSMRGYDPGQVQVAFRGYPEPRLEQGIGPSPEQRIAALATVRDDLVAARETIEGAITRLEQLKTVRGSYQAAETAKLKRTLDAAEQTILSGVGQVVALQGRQYVPEQSRSTQPAARLESDQQWYRERAGQAKSQFEAAATAAPRSLAAQQSQRPTREPTQQTPAATTDPLVARQSQAKVAFNNAVRPDARPITADVESLGSRQVQNEQPRPAPRPSWAADVDRALHQQEMKLDDREAAAYREYVGNVVATLQARRSAGMTREFQQSRDAGQSL
jgi:hypothetical protein